MSRNQLKYLAIIAMVIDHAAWAFVPLASVPGQIMHFIGRLTGPTMAYFLSEGFVHTHDVRKYAIRLGVFAFVSWIPYSLFETGTWPTKHVGVIYTLFLGLLTLVVLYRTKLPRPWKALLVVGLLMLSSIGDWAFFDVVWPVIFYQFRSDERKKWCLYCLTAVFVFYPVAVYPAFSLQHPQLYLCDLGVYVVPFLIHFGYDGRSGSRRPFHSWFFYVFYPSHLFLLYLLKTFR